ncbi:MAG: ferredoxin--NADP reductase [Gammaproteobacteria bacterium]|nr:ferredoxin--NADP reductase [Gammaproteobacteria bacterium]
MAYSEQTVTSIQKWSDKTFSFTTTRPQDFQFENGEFVTLGLKAEGKLIARAYSIVSNNASNHLEFLSIHVPDGPLTSRLAQIQIGEGVWINSKTTGSLTLKYVQPGRTLYMLSTGTGLAPFMSLVRSSETYTAFERIVLIHTVRTVKELAYKDELESLQGERLIYVPTVTRETFHTPVRGTELFKSGELFAKHQLPHAHPEYDRIMICGNPDMNKDMTDYLKQQGWTMTNHRGIGNFTVEKAFVLHHE